MSFCLKRSCATICLEGVSKCDFAMSRDVACRVSMFTTIYKTFNINSLSNQIVETQNFASLLPHWNDNFDTPLFFCLKKYGDAMICRLYTKYPSAAPQYVFKKHMCFLSLCLKSFCLKPFCLSYNHFPIKSASGTTWNVMLATLLSYNIPTCEASTIVRHE